MAWWKCHQCCESDPVEATDALPLQSLDEQNNDLLEIHEAMEEYDKEVEKEAKDDKTAEEPKEEKPKEEGEEEAKEEKEEEPAANAEEVKEQPQEEEKLEQVPGDEHEKPREDEAPLLAAGGAPEPSTEASTEVAGAGSPRSGGRGLGWSLNNMLTRWERRVRPGAAGPESGHEAEFATPAKSLGWSLNDKLATWENQFKSMSEDPNAPAPPGLGWKVNDALASLESKYSFKRGHEDH